MIIDYKLNHQLPSFLNLNVSYLPSFYLFLFCFVFIVFMYRWLRHLSCASIGGRDIFAYDNMKANKLVHTACVNRFL